MLTLRRAIRSFFVLLLLIALGVSVHSERAVAAPTFVSGASYTVDKTWTRAGSPYVLNGDVTVETGATLTVEPGVVVKLNGATRSIRVKGSLKAIGLPGQRIVFTSGEDDSDGVNIGAAGNTGAVQGAKGQWMRFYVTGSAELRHADVRYGGNNCCGASRTYGVLHAYGGDVTIDQTVVAQNLHSGIYASRAGSTSGWPKVNVTNSVLSDNGVGVSTLDATAEIRSSVIANSTNMGVYVGTTSSYAGPAPVVYDSDIVENGEPGVYLFMASGIPLTSWPKGSRNNIYDNDAAAVTPLQLRAGGSDWTGNFWGRDVRYADNPTGCATISPYAAGRLEYSSSTTNPKGGPLTRGSYLKSGGGTSVLCYYDKPIIGPNEFSKTPILREGGPAPEIDPLNDLFDLKRTFGSCNWTPHAATPILCQSDPVQSATGNFTHSAVDLALPGNGVPFTFERAYNSLDERDGPLGRGWTHSYDIGLGIASNGDVELHGEHGATLQFPKQVDGSYGDRAGVRSALEKVTGGYKLTRSDRVVYRFDDAGTVLSIRDRNGQGLSFSRSGSQLTGITDSAGRAITLSYNASGKLSEVELPDGRDTLYGYTNGLLTSVTDTRDKVTTYGYDGSQRLTTEVDGNNHTAFANTYGTDGRVTEQLDALGKKTTFSWDSATETATATDARGNAWKDVYKNRVAVARIDPLGNTTRYGYDADFNRTSEIDPRGHMTTTAYDTRGNVVKRTAPAPLSYEQEFTYDAQNNVTTATDALDRVTTFGYDAAGNLTSVIEPGNGATGFTTEYGRDPAGTGLLKSVTNPRGKTTSYEHDAAGNVTTITSPGGSKETRGYDQSGRLTSRVTPRGNLQGATPADFKTTYTYDNGNNLTSETDPNGHAWTFGYDDVGNPTTRTDPKNRTTLFGYDAANRLASVTASDNSVTAYGRDAIGNVTSRTDAKNHTTTWAYDAANRLASQVSPTGDTYVYGYDQAGNRTAVIDANGNDTPASTDGKATYSFDALNRLTAIDYSDATPDVVFGYDANGNRTSMTDGGGSETYSYDPRDQLTGVTRGSDSFSYAYDPAGNLTERTYPGGATTAYSYDDDGRLDSVTANSATTAYDYDADGHLTKTTLPSANGYIETRRYDQAGQLTEVGSEKQLGPSLFTTLFSATYAYDAAGNPTSVAGTDGPVHYTYDGQDRLTEACYAATCTDPTDPFMRYAYDDVGNRLSETRPSGTTTYTYDDSDRIISKTLGSMTTNYSFDRNGNQTAVGGRTFSWDLANRLKSTSGSGATESYTYDGDGKRLTASTGAAAADSTKYLWDITHGDAELAVERDGADAARRTYTYGHDRLAMRTGGSSSYFHHDAIGSVTNVTSGSGGLQWSYGYEPFGDARTTSKDDVDAPANPMRFAGEMLDTSSDLYHLRARQYDPADGRFLSTDPLAPSAADPSISTYHYAKNRPAVLIDPSGKGVVWAQGPVSGGLAWDGDLYSLPTLDTLGLSTRDRVQLGAGGTALIGGGAVVVGLSAHATAACLESPMPNKLVCTQIGTYGAGLGASAMTLGLDLLGRAFQRQPATIDSSPCANLGVLCVA